MQGKLEVRWGDKCVIIEELTTNDPAIVKAIFTTLADTFIRKIKD